MEPASVARVDHRRYRTLCEVHPSCQSPSAIQLSDVFTARGQHVVRHISANRKRCDLRGARYHLVFAALGELRDHRKRFGKWHIAAGDERTHIAEKADLLGLSEAAGLRTEEFV